MQNKRFKINSLAVGLLLAIHESYRIRFYLTSEMQIQ